MSRIGLISFFLGTHKGEERDAADNCRTRGYFAIPSPAQPLCAVLCAVPARPTHPSSWSTKPLLLSLTLFSMLCSCFTTFPPAFLLLHRTSNWHYFCSAKGQKKKIKPTKPTFSSREGSTWDTQTQPALFSSHVMRAPWTLRLKHCLCWQLFTMGRTLPLFSSDNWVSEQAGKGGLWEGNSWRMLCGSKTHFNSWRFSKPGEEISPPS